MRKDELQKVRTKELLFLFNPLQAEKALLIQVMLCFYILLCNQFVRIYSNFLVAGKISVKAFLFLFMRASLNSIPFCNYVAELFSNSLLI